ncbi:dienelactone hydrolase family protein [Fictibacillus sp. KIGAM418]|uniref:Dienelactone hydrolase family protein n=1 Tax=Fictibacillus marinisediminis TaxID=2878389 RepID=A0A9X1XC74_9BACL|nr:dienelactone hydrolase family protein [Fictibacillus marinisediminis]MCK6256365.1 dienelactone hydrolase family protein [Fictibacillus marinisediminis]
MFKIHLHSDTLIIVVHEIYGLNQHMKKVCKFLSQQEFDVICPNVLGRETPFDYYEESLAYEHFMKNVGFEKTSEKVKKLVKENKPNYKKIFITGFSVGATVAWICSKEAGVDGIIGYYGSRIRNYTEVSPQCPVLLFFPEEEKSFAVDELITVLQKKDVEVYKFAGKHGFSDPHTANYNEESANQAFHHLKNFLERSDYVGSKS